VFAPGQPEDVEPGKAPVERRAASVAPDDSEVRRVLEYMERERAYLSPELNLYDLARAIAMPPYQLSALLNRRLGKTFFEFINGYRVEEAKRRLLDPAQGSLKILALALECGFNSKSAFNRVFKEITGQTPSDFQRQGRASR
jgi:AraC-like DNA-binding protein